MTDNGTNTVTEAQDMPEVATSDAASAPEPTPVTEATAETTSAPSEQPQPATTEAEVAIPAADVPPVAVPAQSETASEAPSQTPVASTAEVTSAPPAQEAVTASVPSADEGAAASETTEASSEEPEHRGRRGSKLPEEEQRVLWAELTEKKNKHEEVELTVISHNRGGVVAGYKGLEIFLPMSHWSLDRAVPNPTIDAIPGEPFKANVLEITDFETDARRITATRRSILRRSLMDSLEVGQRRVGTVTSILDFGIFVDIGGVDGLVHASEISYDRTKQPSEMVRKGQRVEVIIKDIDRQKKRIYLGMKELLPSPWSQADELFQADSIYPGKVVGLSKAGAFVEIAPGIEGFIRLRELSWTKRVQHPDEILKKGSEVNVKVLEINAKRERLSLSYRQATDNPWEGLSQKFALGTRWEAQIKEISSKGVVVTVEDVEGFLPRGRMGREARRLPDMKAGEQLPVHVVDVDPANQSLIFGLVTQHSDDDQEEGGRREGGPRENREPRGEGGFRNREGGNRGEGGGGRREGGQGGRREGGGRRERGGERGERGGDRDRPVAPPQPPQNELKNSKLIGNFSIGDLLGEAVKKQLNYDDPTPPAAAAPVAAAPETPAVVATPAPIAEAQPEVVVATEPTPAEPTPSVETSAASEESAQS